MGLGVCVSPVNLVLTDKKDKGSINSQSCINVVISRRFFICFGYIFIESKPLAITVNT